MDVYLWCVVAAGGFFLLLSLSNVVFLCATSRRPTATDGPRVSVLVPARNEERNIGRCLESLARQTYRNCEIIVYDDLSDDRTLEIVSEYERKFPNVKVIRGTELAEGWFGKPYAMHRLSQCAVGELLLFTDADTVHAPQSVSWAVTNMQHHRLDALSGSPRHLTIGFGEDLVVPAIYLYMILFLPLWLIPTTPIAALSHLVGQFVMFRASAYRAVGGYGAVRHRISEDIYMGRRLKRHGLKIAFLDAQSCVSCRMYEGFANAVNGICKNIFDFFDKKLYPIVVLSLFILGVILAPVAIAGFECATGGRHAGLAACGAGMFLFSWLLIVYQRRFKWYTPFLYPALFAALIGMAWKSVIDDKLGRGYLWKGRFVR